MIAGASASLLPSLIRLAQLQSEVIDRLALHEAVEAAIANGSASPQAKLEMVVHRLQTPAPRWLVMPEETQLPALLYSTTNDKAGQWGVLRGKNSLGQWVSDWWSAENARWEESANHDLTGYTIAVLRLRKPYVAANSPVFQLVRDEILSHRKLIIETATGGMMINFVALAASFYSMQVYDRVIPTSASQTLLVLTLGVFLAISFELVAKRVRSNLFERLIDQVDQRLARLVYQRFLAIRLDQLPQSVGALAGQMRGYETVRGFFTSLTSNLLVDAPFALLFAAIIAMIGGWLALLPLAFLLLSVAVGVYGYRQVGRFSQRAMDASNRKTGLLVESIEGAETIKSGQGGWRILSRWMAMTDEARESDLGMRNISEHSLQVMAAFQQLSYVFLVAAGALLIGKGELTLGGLIACSILSGRVLAPVSAIPSLLVQWAHTKVALRGLDRIWSLPDDHHGHDHPITIDHHRGEFRFESVVAYYGGHKALDIPGLSIRPGERIGVLGPVGSGKTTFLRLLSGMYKPQEGRILLDDVDIAHIAKPVLAEHIGYVQQEGRLFAGTLRDNLILGQLDPGDEKILSVARQTGLYQAVIAHHPKGLHQEIFEGGTGLSGGQRQLVNLTRAFLRQPSLWLLDEPTASMDRNLELQVTQALRTSLQSPASLVLVTHKVEMLDLVDRIIVIANHQIIMDGPKNLVLPKLQAASASREQAA